MKKLSINLFFAGVLLIASCQEVLEPQPNDRITNDLVLTDAGSVRTVITSLYRGLANLQAVQIIAADMTADHLTHNGTFTQYIEVGTKDMSASNGSANAMWGTIYSMLYTVNFLLEGVPEMDNLVDSQKELFLAYARFFRGYGYFVGVNTFGDMPLVLSTDITANRDIPRSPKAEVIAQIEADLLFALDKVPEESFNSGDLTNGAVKAALARFYLYQENWDKADEFATDVIDGVGTTDYELEANFGDVLTDFSRESILEIVYSANDNPGTSTNYGLNNLFSTRREIIPTNDIVTTFQSSGGDREAVLTFDPNLIKGSDNGWTVSRYGPFDNVPVFRLAEMYLIRAEARAQKNNLNSARSDLNIIRQRSGVDPTDTNTKNLLLLEIERERQVELGFEGHRWYDLKRTGRVNEVMRAFTPNWSDKNLLWPVPLREIQNNPGLAGSQNPGY
ncbi:RagB/SusD family nutrient uptake outer membrane protein [Flammeovirgaceae bacterium SG7u.111]|nr:RagB/SusD family nutrient uptake outer membrane protein [Flammeovirgaceae bacterium SG7u.132]WPO36811.1 RagB/SusD family nutrient uptake outer membrane protein [Flammeovirgaceae bacterium SG7u.111]